MSYTPGLSRISCKVETELAMLRGAKRGIVVARPQTFILNGEAPDDLRAFGRKHAMLFKPSRGSQCIGIRISTPSTFDRVLAAACRSRKPYVVQELVMDSVLYEGHRADLRLYALVSSFSPLRFRVYRGGVVRIAARAANNASLDDGLAVLTGASYRKRHHADPGNATVEDFLSRLRAEGFLLDDFWERVDALMQDAFSCLVTSLPLSRANSSSCFYLTGFDVLLRPDGRRLQPIFIESNYFPQLNSWGAAVDHALRAVHREWVTDLRNLVRSAA